MLERIGTLCAWPGRVVGWLLLPLMVIVLVTVAAASLGWNEFLRWGVDLPVLGPALTVNSLLDLQWYIFALVALFGTVYAFREDRHVCVDFLSARFPDAGRRLVQLFGDVIFLLPFCTVMVWYGIDFAERAWVTGEGSSYGGLLDRWLIKACVPLAFGLLGVAGMARVISNLRALAGRHG
ncbi:TRAP transporter small permease subunit [Arhodomonas sp. SL1]|uniref:TRAP transporter small permease subunit n=1 Tax=Arhodomonas sp. SL1 TaxID=3425691 RepID=UPI003F88183A